MRTVTVLVTACLCATLGLACAPAALTEDQIVPAFIAATQADTRSMHMEWQGTVNQLSGGDLGSGLGQINQQFTGVFDFNGPDYAGDIVISLAGLGQSNSVSYARVGGNSFLNYSGSGWQSADAVGVGPSELDPMHDLAAEGVAYEAADTFAGQPVHRLRVLDPLAALGGGMFDQANFTGASLDLNGPSEYLVYVDANGIPVAAHVALALQLTVTATEVASPSIEYQMDFDYTFSLWGEPVAISPPQVTNNSGGVGKVDGAPPPIVQPSN